jgi:hypothetical protein
MQANSCCCYGGKLQAELWMCMCGRLWWCGGVCIRWQQALARVFRDTAHQSYSTGAAHITVYHPGHWEDACIGNTNKPESLFRNTILFAHMLIATAQRTS